MKNNPSIKEIDLSNSYLVQESEISLADLASIFKADQIEKFVLMGNGATVYGSRLIPVLECLTQSKTLKILDITGQAIGDFGLNLFSKLLSTGLKDFYFDGSNPTKFLFFKNACEAILGSQLTQTCWPENDFQLLVSKSSPNEKSEVNSAGAAFKKKFHEKFVIFEARHQTRANSVYKSEVKVRSQSDILSFREIGVDTCVKECLNLPPNDFLSEPLVALLDKMNQETSIETFLGVSA